MMLCVRCRANARRRLPTRPAIARHTGTVLTEVLLVRAAAGKVLLVRAVLLPGTVGTTSSFLELVVRSRRPIQYLHDAHDTYTCTACPPSSHISVSTWSVPGRSGRLYIRGIIWYNFPNSTPGAARIMSGYREKHTPGRLLLETYTLLV